MKLLQWSPKQWPREKLLTNGPDGLSDAELVAIILRTGTKDLNVVEMSRALLTQFGSLNRLLALGQEEFCAINGLGLSKYVQLQASIEIARRCFAESLSEQVVLDSAADTRMFLLSQLRHEPNEVFAVLFLDSQHRLIAFEKVFYGTINCANVYPRVLVKRALEKNAAALILAHNHPSGVAEPSQADRQITQRIVNAMSLVDIHVLDHFVVGAGETVSFAERGWM